MERKKPISVIFDTDIGGDCDDAGALALLHRLCDLGEAQLLAVTHCYSNPFKAGCIDAINTYHGREVPIGINYSIEKQTGRYDANLCREFPNKYPENTYGTDKGAPDTLTVLRRTLAEAEDNSVTLVIVGHFTSAAMLLQSTPDEISPLSGKELIEKKITRTVAMGGHFQPTTSFPSIIPEYNIRNDIPSAKLVCDEWPGELVLSGFEIGLQCISMQDYAVKAPKDDPVRRAYECHPEGCKLGRESWDHSAVLEAVRPGMYWDYHARGRIRINDDGVSSWEAEDEGKQTYLLPKVDFDEIRSTIDDLVCAHINGEK